MGAKVQGWSDELEAGVVANVVARHGVRVVTWPVLQQAGIEDKLYTELLQVVGDGTPVWP